MSTQRETARRLPQLLNIPGTRLLAAVLATAVIAYIAWKIGQSPPQALQFAFNGIAVGAVYALLAMGFTLVYSTVWFFDLYYGAAAGWEPTASFTCAPPPLSAAAPMSTAFTSTPSSPPSLRRSSAGRFTPCCIRASVAALVQARSDSWPVWWLEQPAPTPAWSSPIPRYST